MPFAVQRHRRLPRVLAMPVTLIAWMLSSLNIAGWGALNIKSSLGRGGYVTNVTYANVTLGRGPFPWALGVGV